MKSHHHIIKDDFAKLKVVLPSKLAEPDYRVKLFSLLTPNIESLWIFDHHFRLEIGIV
jgi:hypothetical protein